ncbi:RP-L19 [Lepeophtheirus salmonis]|nr:RP-L19 [Lepeophtheirus salmonis]CAF2896691.1 RP-L19 [Lepeophtheirus salmonis]
MFLASRAIFNSLKRSCSSTTALKKYRSLRFAFPEFLPDPDPNFRNALAEKLARQDMLRRREVAELPEFYVGSVVSVTVSDQNTQLNKFVGIVMDRGGTGLRAWMILRNVVDGEGIEIMYDLYSPVLHKIEVLRLERRLDDELYYLRDAPLKYSTIPFDTDPLILPEGSYSHFNDEVITLNPRPWTRRWELYLDKLKGFKIGHMDMQTEARLERNYEKLNPGWRNEYLQYDLLRDYKNTIPIEEQNLIWNEVGEVLLNRNVAMRKVAAQKAFVKPVKDG